MAGVGCRRRNPRATRHHRPRRSELTTRSTSTTRTVRSSSRDSRDFRDFDKKSTDAAPDRAAFEGAGFEGAAAAPAHTEPAADTQELQGEPGEEPTDASDLLVVSGLGVEVRVVDEHPRYHLASCAWLATRATIPIAVSEARQLGFTPCARCGPDARLAAAHRAAR